MTISDLVSEFRSTMRRVAGAALLRFFLAVNPIPAARPRLTKFGAAYYPKTYAAFLTKSKSLASLFDSVPTDRPVMVMLEMVVEKPRTGKLEFPRGDSDNFAKGPLDALTQAGKFWNDDNQIVGLAVFKRYAKPTETPGVMIEWTEVDSN